MSNLIKSMQASCGAKLSSGTTLEAYRSQYPLGIALLCPLGVLQNLQLWVLLTILENNIIKKSFLFLSVGFSLISFITQPVAAVAADVTEQDQTNLKEINYTTASSRKVSSKAQDLWEQPQKELALQKFCQNYPLNSRCSQKNPSNEADQTEISPRETPVPQINHPSNQPKTGWAVIPEISTLGLGGQIVSKISPNFNVRAGINAFDLGIEINETEFDYEGDLNLFNVSTIIDLHPFKGSGFRLSGGLIFGNNNIRGTADVSEQVADGLGEVEIDGETIDIRELDIEDLATIDTDIEISNGVAPYFGIGGGNAVGEDKELGFWWNLGVVFGGSPKVETTSNISDDIPAELQAEVKASADEVLEDEEEDLETELDFLRFYPVVSLGFSYQF